MIVKRQKSFSKVGELKKAERAAKKKLKEEWIRKTYPGSDLRSSRTSMQMSGWHTGKAYTDRGIVDSIKAGEDPTMASILNKAKRDVAGNHWEGTHDKFDREAIDGLLRDREYDSRFPKILRKGNTAGKKPFEVDDIVRENKEIMDIARAHKDYDSLWRGGKSRKYFKKQSK